MTGGKMITKTKELILWLLIIITLMICIRNYIAINNVYDFMMNITDIQDDIIKILKDMVL